IGIPGIGLMENSVLQVVAAIKEYLGEVAGKRILIFCGRGNNGGDGYVVARHLYNQGARVEVYLAGQKDKVKGDALTNLKILEAMGLPVQEIATSDQLTMTPGADLVVDALLGTGVVGPVTGFLAEVIEFINHYGAPVIAIDLPSGMETDTGEVKGAGVSAICTVTMGHLKRGLLFSPGRDRAGKVVVADISIPWAVTKESKANTYFVEGHDVRTLLPRRASDAYKNQCGTVLVIAGSVGLTGAATLTATSVLRAGAGMAILGAPESLNPILAGKLTEVMTRPLPETEARTISLRAQKDIEGLLDWADVLAVGPGLGTHEETRQLVEWIVREINKPMVIDADGLNALAGKGDLIKSAKGSLILTPHPGELSRLLGVPIKDILKNRIELVRETAKNWRATLVLKGAPTITGDPNGQVYINSSGNAGMATAGSGDVLTGIIAGLLAQGMAPKDAALAGVFVHGAAGDLAQKKLGEKGLIAGDIAQYLPQALKSIETS
ncbi:MAG: NAD(P)H-hydrate dehydratase, partial [candidate division KSB1 bacterium]|nr:NAD(P)H-hydrate dehydratase [candidate division KSB1 bacterium]